MPASRFTVILLLSFIGAVLCIPDLNSSDPFPIPHPTLGLQFALPPAPPNSSFIYAPLPNNRTTITPRSGDGSPPSNSIPVVWTNWWFPPPVCNPDGTCTSSSNDDIPHLKLNGNLFTVNGRVFAGIFNSPGNTLKWGLNVNAHTQAGFAGGAWGLETPIVDCGPFDRSHVADSFAAAYDWATGKWSTFRYLYTGCYVY